MPDNIDDSIKSFNNARMQIESLARFVSTSLANLKHIETPLLKETSQQGMEAHSQLKKVAETTEIATFDMLEKINALMEKQIKLGELLESFKKKNPTDDFSELQNLVDSSQMDTMELMNAMQFQDITAQQIKQVEKLMAGLLKRLGQLCDILDIDRKKVFSGDFINDEPNPYQTFDKNAKYDTSSDSQENINDIISNLENKKKEKTSNSQDMIDDIISQLENNNNR